MSEKKLSEPINQRSQTGLVSVGIAVVNESIGRRSVQKPGNFAVLNSSRIFFGLAPESFDSGTNAAPFGAVSVTLTGRGSHTFNTVFMNWHSVYSSI